MIPSDFKFFYNWIKEFKNWLFISDSYLILLILESDSWSCWEPLGINHWNYIECFVITRFVIPLFVH